MMRSSSPCGKYAMIAFMLTLLSAVPAYSMQLEMLRQRLSEGGAGWVAAETSLSHLSAEEFGRMLGFVPLSSHDSVRQQDVLSGGHALYSLPAAFDWRNNNGNWIAPVRDQDTCGACAAFAALAAFETLIMQYEGSPGSAIDLSEQYLVSCGPAGTRDGYAYGGCTGNYSDYIADFLRNVGVPDEACFPYVEGQDTGTEAPCDSSCADAADRIEKISGWSYIASQSSGYLPSPEQIKAVLVEKPVPCGMLIYDDFKYYAGGIYEPVSGQETIGGHLACIVGYDDSQQCWIVKNSWGEQWGENGFFRIGYDQTSGSSLTMFGIEALDLSYGGAVTTTTTTSIAATTTIPEGEKPNIIPCAPHGWSFPIVPSSQQGTSDFNPASDVLYPSPRKTFIDFAVCNDSNVPLTEPFAVSLFIDGTEAYTGEISGDIAGKSYRAWIDEEYLFSEGEHALLLTVDVRDEIAETDEDDNSVEMNFIWTGLWPGVYERMLGAGSGDTVKLLRQVRDGVLMAGGEGRESVRMLYRLSREIAALLLNDAGLRQQTADVIRQLLPEASCLADGETVLLSAAKRSACEGLLDGFAARGGADVRTLAALIKEKMREGTLFGELGIRTE